MHIDTSVSRGVSQHLIGPIGLRLPIGPIGHPRLRGLNRVIEEKTAIGPIG